MTRSTPTRPKPFAAIDDISRRQLIRIGAVSGAGLALGIPTLTACNAEGDTSSDPTAEPPSTPTGTLRVANNGEPNALDPAIAEVSSDGGIVLNNVYEGLLRYQEGSHDVVGALAASFESSPDVNEWTFRLKEGVTFHDGEPLTSAAVKASFEHYAAAPLDPIGVKTVLQAAEFDDSDPLVFRATMSTPFPDMARIATMVHIISPKLVEAGPEAVNTTPTGTGPFRFVSYSTAQDVILEANPDYRGPGPYLERLEFPIIPDADSRVAALRSGSVDLVLEISPTNAGPLRDDPNIAVTEKQVTWSTKLLMFTQSPPLDNLKVRQALAHAIDREALVNSVMEGVGEVDDGWTVPTAWGYQPPQTTYPYDVERAKQLLGDSGVSAPEIVLGLVGEVEPHIRRLTQAIATMAEAAGFVVAVEAVPITDWIEVYERPKEPRPWHAWVGSFGFPDGSTAHLNHVYNNIIENVHQVFDPELKELNARVVTTPDGPERDELLAEMAERVAQLAPLHTLFTNTQIDAYKTAVQGYKTAKHGAFPDYGQVYLAG